MPCVLKGNPHCQEKGCLKAQISPKKEERLLHSDFLLFVLLSQEYRVSMSNSPPPAYHGTERCVSLSSCSHAYTQLASAEAKVKQSEAFHACYTILERHFRTPFRCFPHVCRATLKQLSQDDAVRLVQLRFFSFFPSKNWTIQISSPGAHIFKDVYWAKECIFVLLRRDQVCMVDLARHRRGHSGQDFGRTGRQLHLGRHFCR